MFTAERTSRASDDVHDRGLVLPNISRREAIAKLCYCGEVRCVRFLRGFRIWNDNALEPDVLNHRGGDRPGVTNLFPTRITLPSRRVENLEQVSLRIEKYVVQQHNDRK